MGASAEGEYKRQRGVLSRLKKIAVVIAILDLILAINDSRNVGRFFLLLTMSSTFDTSPENVIRDHCHSEKNVEGICETYFTTIAGGTPETLYRTFDGKSSNYYGATKAFRRYIFPETFKELVNSWLAMFDQSRSDANVSFYYDGAGGGGVDQTISLSEDVPYRQETYLVDKKHNMSDRNHNQSHLNSSGLHVNSGDSESSSTDKRSPSSNNDKSSSTSTNSPHTGRKKRGVSSNRERNSADTGGTLVVEHEKHANSNTLQVTITSASPPILKNIKGIKIPSKNKNEILSTVQHNQGGLVSPSSEPSTNEEKVKQRLKPKLSIPPPGIDGAGRKDFLRGNYHHCKARNTNTKLPEFDNGIMSKGPKKLITFVQDEVFTRWPCLLQEVRDVLEQRNMTSSVSPEARRIKMLIDVTPFGPDSFKDSSKRLKATHQILFDYPWLTMFQIHSRLSGAFTKMFIVISLYTWIWGTVIALMLLIGSLTEDQTTLHHWIIFNILYSLLLFMIDDWIHSNICPQRSSVSVWLFVIYSLYKPIAAWIGFTQWSEMKKVASLEASLSFSTSATLKSKCLNNRRSCSNSPSKRRRLRLSSDGMTKETTVVDIITPTPTPSLPTRSAKSINGSSSSTLMSTVEIGHAQDAPGSLGYDGGTLGDGNCNDVDIEEFEDLDEEDGEGEDWEMDQEASDDSEDEGETTKDLEKVCDGNSDEE